MRENVTFSRNLERGELSVAALLSLVGWQGGWGLSEDGAVTVSGVDVISILTEDR